MGTIENVTWAREGGFVGWEVRMTASRFRHPQRNLPSFSSQYVFAFRARVELCSALLLRLPSPLSERSKSERAPHGMMGHWECRSSFSSPSSRISYRRRSFWVFLRCGKIQSASPSLPPSLSIYSVNLQFSIQHPSIHSEIQAVHPRPIRIGTA